MTAVRPVVSARPFAVLAVEGRPPTDLSDFVGHRSMELDLDGDRYPVCGEGRLHGDAVRLFEKDHDGEGKDVRVWTVAGDRSAGFTAAHLGP
jgi:hypothetical protein